MDALLRLFAPPPPISDAARYLPNCPSEVFIMHSAPVYPLCLAGHNWVAASIRGISHLTIDLYVRNANHPFVDKLKVFHKKTVSFYRTNIVHWNILEKNIEGLVVQPNVVYASLSFSTNPISKDNELKYFCVIININHVICRPGSQTENSVLSIPDNLL